MKSVYTLENTIMNYPWGSRTAVTSVLGLPNPGNKPVAEIWMGAHPKAPSVVFDGNRKVPLDRFIAEHGEAVLGRSARKFGSVLPFLFKILSAGEPLSIQAHPNLDQAARGFDREEKLGIPLNAPERNYKDRNHKPEIICALSGFLALRGFRPPEEIAELLSDSSDQALSEAAARTGIERTHGNLRELFTVLRQMGPERVMAAASRLLRALPEDRYEEKTWLQRLLRRYPGDPGVFAPLYLNFVTLSPGQAMYLPAGELHAYLEGTGVELMANSDNVLRGGLTSKHVDSGELLSILTFDYGKPEILLPVSCVIPGVPNVGRAVYKTPGEEFSLSALTVNRSQDTKRGILKNETAAIMVCVEGKIECTDCREGNTIIMKPGDSVFISAGSGYTLDGTGKLYQAAYGNENLD